MFFLGGGGGGVGWGMPPKEKIFKAREIAFLAYFMIIA